MNTYRPSQPPVGLDPLVAEYIHTELQRIAAIFPDPRVISIDQTVSAPTKPRAGDIRLADGSGWSPGGGGAGYYGYYGGAWVKLG